jgi:prepilin-type N-terminal cleavage/methylation domain-containing protein
MVPLVRDKGDEAVRDRRAFTLIELLVVISIIVLLMALLLPALRRAKGHAQAVVCQGRLRQGGVGLMTYLMSDEGRAPGEAIVVDKGIQSTNPLRFFVAYPPYKESPELAVCPSATEPPSEPTAPNMSVIGGPFAAWVVAGVTASHGQNLHALGANKVNEDLPGERARMISWSWQTWRLKSIANVPVIGDSMTIWSGLDPGVEPPPYNGSLLEPCSNAWCMNRHAGGVNCLFATGSVRKVGLKELWTLKWHPEFDTAGPWTKAGGVRPEDWPEWMRDFKDY